LEEEAGCRILIRGKGAETASGGQAQEEVDADYFTDSEDDQPIDEIHQYVLIIGETRDSVKNAE
jgi:hypothetical protein